MSSNDTLYQMNERGYRCGLANLLRKEQRAWWGTRKWWVNALVWLLIVNGIVALLMWGVPALVSGTALNDPNMPEEQKQTVRKDMAEIEGNRDTFGLQGFFQLAGMATAIGVMIVGQGAIIGEKQSGTAAWVLSCPVSHSAFILSKAIALGISSLVIMIGLQGLVAYLQISLARGSFLPLLPFVGSLGLLGLHLLFYLSLILMLGTLFDSRGPVIGIPMVVLVGQGLMGHLAQSVAPWLSMLLPERLPEMALLLAGGQSMPSFVPLTATLLMAVGFILVALWRFKGEEF